MERTCARIPAKLCCLVLLLVYSCVPRERSTVDVEVRKPIIITKNDTIYVQVVRDSTLGEKYEVALRKYVGTKEATGNNDGEIIEYILATCGINIPAPWCACYLNQGLLDIGLSGPPYQPGYTPRWFEDQSRIVWTRDVGEAHFFEKGWVAGIYFRSKSRIAHVACVLEDFKDGYILTIEGNTNSAGSRDGNGVFIRIRHKSEIYMCSDWLN